MKKGITPIISIIVLLLITVALAGVAWVYLSGFLGSQIETSFNVPPGGTFCTSNLITVMVTNTGTGTLEDEDFIIANVDGTAATKEYISLAPKSGAVLVDAYDCGSACASGSHTIDLSTAAATITRTVVC